MHTVKLQGLTVAAAASILNVTSVTIRSWASKGFIRSWAIGRRLYVSTEQVILIQVLSTAPTIPQYAKMNSICRPTAYWRAKQGYIETMKVNGKLRVVGVRKPSTDLIGFEAMLPEERRAISQRALAARWSQSGREKAAKLRDARCSPKTSEHVSS